jgi:basic membrane lipoprotein Med (substrate-binding protein (PBP1-ABC) superfamily)
VFGLADNGVGLGKISPHVPRADRDAVDNVRKKIVSGEISDIPKTVP